MHTSTPATPGYTFADLDEPARRFALHLIAQTNPEPRWDLEDIDHAAATMTATLATVFGSPAGEVDLDVTVWDARRFSLAGFLRPDTATGLPWTHQMRAVRLDWHRRVRIHHTRRGNTGDLQQMRTAVENTIAAAWQHTRQQVQHRHTLEWIAAHQPRFTTTGSPMPAWPWQESA